LTAKGTGRDFADPVTVKNKLVKGFLGFTEQIAYQANGPTGTATGMTRDLGLDSVLKIRHRQTFLLRNASKTAFFRRKTEF
jgi:hypothetical protein